MSKDTTHLNLAINGILRKIDTILETPPKPGCTMKRLDLVKQQLDILQKNLTNEATKDLDIPNDVFVGVSNETRKLCMFGLWSLASLSANLAESMLKTVFGDKLKDL